MPVRVLVARLDDLAGELSVVALSYSLHP